MNTNGEERAGSSSGEERQAETSSGAHESVGHPEWFLSELLGGVEREPLQVELRGVRVLFELLRFLLSCRIESSKT